ncbi:NAD(P)/FAD-dependent oxidoreductase [Paracoccus saliphilus]|uniref:3-phenylpropionate/trans-cinnamate dioxygenase ferredoxin reductase subunit n=1 Tax=Paracoccus saliphilus TaxID=405559 RepID=A0AA46A465_9RHOB|nr:FAD-dependent oxidoreductase [Paracoccus saliphilus]WCR03598.1 FAD-dependent oxidoreductase [Paracoccus saliphilus]SIS56395.1 3-phenylpropionate/trans-cinnamate dioxygenase ferredoxin reductase subunit [Paracoccus saliphilus]
MERVVVIGTGQGGFQLAASLRQEGFSGRITLIGEEPGLPYQRPPLSKDYLKDGNDARLLLRAPDFYEQQRIEIIGSTRVAGIDRAAMEVETGEGARIAYDHLVLATGSRNRIPPILGLDRPDVLALRTLSDARALRDRVEQMRRVVVIGGGFIGLEFAAVARACGIEVVVVEGADRLMGRAVAPMISRHFLDAHSDWGSSVHLGQFAEAVTDAKGSLAVRLGDGSEVSGDTVVLAAGVIANDSIAEDAGLTTDDGIVVDDLLHSSDPDISALGDCCRFVEPVSGVAARLESVQAATDHARTIAARLVGRPKPYGAVPWFWSNQGDRKLQIAGYAPDADDWHVAEADGKLAVFCFAGDRLAAVETVGNAGAHMAARRLLASEGRVPRKVLEAVGYDLKAVMAAA